MLLFEKIFSLFITWLCANEEFLGFLVKKVERYEWIYFFKVYVFSKKFRHSHDLPSTDPKTTGSLFLHNRGFTKTGYRIVGN